MRTIYVAGYPRSGTTWLTRLLGDALNCPTGAALPSLDGKEPATEGLNRPGPFVVRKGHLLPVDDQRLPVIPKSHQLAWRSLTDEAVVFIVRDPRDVAVSASFYWERSLAEQVELMTGNNLRSWRPFVLKWLESPFPYTLVKYEDLLEYPTAQMSRILATNQIDYNRARLETAIVRQSFDVRKRWTRKHGDRLVRGKEYQLRFLRKGVVGDWVNHFTPELERKLMGVCRNVCERLGYVS